MQLQSPPGVCSGKIIRFSTCRMEQSKSRAAWDWRDHLVPCEQSEALKGEAGTFLATVEKSTSKQSEAEIKNFVAAEGLRGFRRAVAQFDQ